MKLISRSLYLNRIAPHMDSPAVKLLSGMRRCGKTVLLFQLRQWIAEQGVPPERLIYVDFESRKFEHLRQGRALHDFVAEKVRAAAAAGAGDVPSAGSSEVRQGAEGKIYLFFDEIQKMEGWQSAVSAISADFDCDLYLAGSDARLLSFTDAAVFHIYPFTLSEICQFCQANRLPYTKEHLFVDYLKYGGLPTRLMLPDEQAVTAYLQDVYHSILVSDIFSANAIRNSSLLESLTEFLFDHMGTLFSARAIHRALKEAGRKMTVETVLQYLSMLQEGLLFSKAGRYDIKAGTPLASTEKYYTCDIGLRNALRTMEGIDYNKLFENIVYLEMQSRGYDVKAGKLGGYDIDFVCTKNGDRIYIQVAYLIILDQIGWEFGSLEKIKDHYPKYVISNDVVDMSRNGIRHLNIMDFLLE